MKRKFYLLALVCAVAGTSVISSCKDTDEDYYNDLKTQIQNIQAVDPYVFDLAKELGWTKGKDALADFLNSTPTTVEQIKEAAKAKSILGVTIQDVANPVYGSFSLPVGVENRVLANYYSSVTDGQYFPSLSADERTILAADDKIEKLNLTKGETVKLGQVYMTINPSNEDYSDLKPVLVNSNGEELGVKLGDLTACEDVLYFGVTPSTRAAANVYATEATIARADLEKVQFNNVNLRGYASEIREMIQTKKIKAAELAHMLKDIVDSKSNATVRRGVQLTATTQLPWQETKTTSVLSELSIAAAVVQPLGFETVEAIVDKISLDRIKNNLKPITVDVNAAINASANLAVTGTDSYGNPVNGNASGPVTGNATTTVTVDPLKKARKYIEKIEKYIDRISDATAPAIVTSDAKGMQLLSLDPNAPTYVDADVQLLATSLCAETLVPFAKKFVAITKIDGGSKAVADVNAGENMNKVLDGPSIINCRPAALEAGAQYEVVYSAADFAGAARTYHFYFRVRN